MKLARLRLPVVGYLVPRRSGSSSPYGFWVFLLSSVGMFFGALCEIGRTRYAPADRPTGDELFKNISVAIETGSQAGLLKCNSIKCGPGTPSSRLHPPLRRLPPPIRG